MRFLYHKDSGNPYLELSGDSYRHIFKSRRHKKEQSLLLSNLKDTKLYEYSVSEISRNSASLTLINTITSQCHTQPYIHIIWAIVDSNAISKALPTLNELNVSKLSFFYADFSQRNTTLNLERLKNILIHSCEQCGRSTLLEFEIAVDLESVCEKYRNLCAFDLRKESLPISQGFEKYTNNGILPVIVVGPEGGFSTNERKTLEKYKIPDIRIPNSFILQSSSACIFAASALQIYSQSLKSHF
ncbi:MAG: 16S rRNA (uracil(1498)-N(3))-methyltransferase [Helicobacter sp.]|uniref:16S rRNA (uracil(1498)-N(3))-methyltransferase n=1 Tax=Helicobacter sp. 10-6591 TaxID=2004998 RepID=UPI000DCD41C1|nr:16S rRNA (uracil(1498)-N(3))-methyltransferase [Helicobacter sp. 10-6591]MCI6217443.1 16S rRNA (uracil(1498)-N(3))-methyltransferase [Helicobacter sp.]MDD7566847.1 16S rRNA (uracil(1498)-N(3))-methyltransferase [Helicobacter sp.]MDY5740182.1 16S rRNA (uracil(1498)-N(3))-methyltransferase [Helicobacter sp.]RAX55834.1 16S rRNA (uracil(1498)-N(3))-methyltransferase [Helicobacter sp. 10-6591]